jgi:hypothetical protein
MKYIVFYETKPEDFDAAFAHSYAHLRKKYPEKYPSFVKIGDSDEHAFSMGTGGKLFAIVEATPEQMANHVLAHAPMTKMTYVPITGLSLWYKGWKMIKEAST